MGMARITWSSLLFLRFPGRKRRQPDLESMVYEWEKMGFVGRSWGCAP